MPSQNIDMCVVPLLPLSRSLRADCL